MVTSLCTYFAKEVFPKYVDLLEDNSRLSFLHLIDQMISLHLIDQMTSFDKRTLTLISNSGQLLSPREDESLQRVSVSSVFCDWPDWLDIWAAIELGEMLEKLDHEASRNNADDWLGRLQISSDLWCSLYQCLSTVIERPRSLPSIFLRANFIRLAGAPLVREFFDCLLCWYQETEGLTALADDDAITKVSNSINAARYCESILSEWLEDMFFLEMEEEGKSIFEEEIEGLRAFRTEWVEKVSTMVLRGPVPRLLQEQEAVAGEGREGGWAMSKALVGDSRLSPRENFQAGGEFERDGVRNSVEDCGRRSRRAGFQSCFDGWWEVPQGGVERFGVVLEVLFGVFGKWCLRQERFFRRLSEGPRQLKMGEGGERGDGEGEGKVVEGEGDKASKFRRKLR